MQVGIFLIFQGDGHGLDNERMIHEELGLAVLADELGYDSAWVPEHYTNNAYSISGDPTQLLAYLSARTRRIKLGTAGIILPWWDPLRAVHNISLADILSDGRCLVGFGRGLAPREYAAFRIDMNESRARFDEAAAMIVEALETGVLEYAGEIFRQPRVEVHPASPRSFRDRIFSIAVSPASALAAADLGATLMMFVRQDANSDAQLIRLWRERFEEKHHRAPPNPPIMLDFTYCHHDAHVAERVARRYLTQHFKGLIDHYSWDGDQWAGIKGYETYAAEANSIKAAGLDQAARAIADEASWGTPEQVIEKVMRRREIIGPYDVMFSPAWGGIPYASARASMALVAREVMPTLRSL